MNIKFGMDNFYVRYLKRFLNHELDIPTSLLGSFSKNDLQQVIKYLNLPNVKSMFEVQKEIQQQILTKTKACLRHAFLLSIVFHVQGLLAGY